MEGPSSATKLKLEWLECSRIKPDSHARGQHKRLEKIRDNILVETKDDIQVLDLEFLSPLVSCSTNTTPKLDIRCVGIEGRRDTDDRMLVIMHKKNEDSYFLKLLARDNSSSFSIQSAVNSLQLDASPTNSTNTVIPLVLSRLEAQQLLDSLNQIGYQVLFTEAESKVKDITVDNCRRFTYCYDLDGNGIVEFLVNNESNEPVAVTASSISKGTPEKFIEKGEVFCWTQNEPFSWFCVDLGENRAVIPSHYTLRYGSSGAACCPRNWLLQGSNYLPNDTDSMEVDSIHWTTLKVHEDDHSLNKSHACCTWSISDSIHSYRYLRIIQTGPNCYENYGESVDKWSNVLVASGFEVYGVLKEKTTVDENIVEGVRELMAQLKKGIRSISSSASNKQLQWESCTVNMNYITLKTIFLALVPQLAEYTGFTVAHNILEKLKILGAVLGDKEGFSDSTVPTPKSSTSKDAVNKDSRARMNSELHRLVSFRDSTWALTNSGKLYANPSILAEAGFYYESKPQSSGTHDLIDNGTCVCFSCQLSIDSWEASDDPWYPLIYSDMHDMILTRAAQVGTLTFLQIHSVTLASESSAKVSSKEKIIDVCWAKGLPLVVLVTSTGDISVWSISAPLVKLFQSQLLGDLKLQSSSTKLIKSLLLPCEEWGSPFALSLPPEEKNKWVQWCTPLIYVRVTEQGLYPGAHAIVLQVINEDNIVLFILGFEEKVTLPLKHLKPLPPLVHHPALILSGSLKGEGGVVVSINKSTALLKLQIGAMKSIELNSIAAMDSEQHLSRELPPCCLVTAVSVDDCHSIIISNFSSKTIQKLSSYQLNPTDRITSLHYIAALKQLIVTFTRTDSSASVHGIASLHFDESRYELSQWKELLLNEHVEAKHSIIHTFPVHTESVDAIGIVTSNRNVLLVSTQLVAVYAVATIGNESDGEVIDAVYSEQLETLAVNCEENMFTVALLSLEKDVQQKVMEIGAITLPNITALNKLELEKLFFTAYPPKEVKQLMIPEKNGMTVKWDIPPTELRTATDLLFEIELPGVQIVDKIDIFAHFNPSSLSAVSSPSALKDPQYSVTLEYIDCSNKRVQKAMDHYNLLPLLRSGVAHTDLTEEAEDNYPDQHTLSLNLRITTRRIKLTLHYQPTISISTKSTATTTSSTPSSKGSNAVVSNIIHSFGINLYGSRSNSKESLLKRSKRIALFDAKEFHIAILKLLSDSKPFNGLRNACMELMYNIWHNREDIQYSLEHFNSLEFMKQNIITSQSTTSKLAARLLTLALHLAPQFKEELLDKTLEVLEYCVDECKSSVGMDQLFNLITALWTTDAARCFSKSVEVLLSIGHKLFNNRSPFYNILRTHFGLYEFALEADIFSPKKTKKKTLAVVGGEELAVQFSDYSSNITVDEKKHSIKLSKIHRSGNWVIIDLGTASLVTDISINFQTAHNSVTGQLTIDCYLENESDVSRITQKIEPLKKKKKREVYYFHDICKVCRYVKIDIKSFSASGESGTVVVDLYGIADFVSPSQQPDELLNKLRSHLRVAEERHHKLSTDFIAKRRSLTTLLEETNITGDSFYNHETEIQSAYNDCIQAQFEYYRQNEKLKRLSALELEYQASLHSSKELPDTEEDDDESECKIDRWTYAATLICKLLLANLSPNDKLHRQQAEKLFLHYCVFGTNVLRKQVGKLLKAQLQNNEWYSFVSDALQKYFSTAALPISPLNLFPHKEVYKLLQQMIEQGQHKHKYVDNLFALIERASNVKEGERIDMSLVAWSLSLLVNTISSDHSEKKSTVHYGTKCSGCNVSPINGIRYKCVNCPSFDLCENCESKYHTIHDKLHLFLEIPKPIQTHSRSSFSYTNKTLQKDAPLLPVLYTGKYAKQITQNKNSTDDEAALKNTVHSGVSCDGCGKCPISGIRYKCVNCDDFDFCEDCEDKVEHYPLHLFLRVRYPLPPQITSSSTSSSSQLPKALISNQLLISVLSQPPPNIQDLLKASDESGFILEQPDDELADSTQSNLSSHLRSIFSLLLSSRKHPLSRDVLLLATRVIEALAKKHSSSEFFNDVVKNQQFEEFIGNVSNNSDPFLRSAAIHMIQTLCNPSAAPATGERGLQFDKEEMYSTLKHLLTSLIKDTKDTSTSAHFLLELLLIVLQNFSAIKNSEDSLPLSKSSNSLFPLDDASCVILLSFLRRCTLSSQLSARCWCIVFRVLQYAKPSILLKEEYLLQALKTALSAPEELQLLLYSDFTELINAIIENTSGYEITYNDLMAAVVESFPHASGEDNPLLYLTLISALRDNISIITKGLFEVKQIVLLLQFVSSAISAKSDPAAAEPKDRSKKERTLLEEVMELVNIILSKISSPSIYIELLNQSNKTNSFAQLMKWLSLSDSPDSLPPSLSIATPSLREDIVKMIEILSSTDEGAKYFLELSLRVLKDFPSTTVAKLCFKLIRNEQLANYFAVNLKGCSFLFSRVTHSSSAIPSYLTPVSAAILTNIISECSQLGIDAYRSKKSITVLETLNSVAKLVTPNDSLLSRLLKESGNSTSCIWTHEFKKRDNTTIEEEYPITVSFPEDVIVREIQIHAMHNYHIASGSSLFPSFITIETASSIGRAIPCGRIICQANPNQPNPSRCYTSSFKFVLPAVQVSQYIILRVHAPEKPAYIAISRIQFKGHSLGNFHESSSSLATQLPLVVTLDLLAHCLKFTEVQLYLAKQDSTIATSLSLLDHLSSSTCTQIEEILFCESKHSEAVSNAVLERLLTGGVKNRYHAKIAGRICSIRDNFAASRLARLRDFVFTQLRTHFGASFSSQHTPFLDALSTAMSEQPAMKLSISQDELFVLLDTAVKSVQGSLMEQSSMRLLSAIIQSDDSLYAAIIDKMKMSSSEVLLSDEIRVIGMLTACANSAAEYLLANSKLLQSAVTTISNSLTAESPQAHLEAILSFLSNIAHHNSLKTWIGDNCFELLFKLFTNNNHGSQVLYSVIELLKTCANLNTANQHKLSQFLLQQVQLPTVNEWILHLMIELFSFEETVAVCLHTLPGSEDLLAAKKNAELETKYTGIRLDAEFCDPHIEIDENGITANCTATTKWCTVLASTGFSSGVHKWDVVIERCTNTCNIMVGVCERQQNLSYYVGQDMIAMGWSYYCCNGYVYHSSGSKAYGSKLKQGDVLTVELDMDNGTLSFTKNGISYGIAYSTGFEGKEVYPAVSLYDLGDSVTIIDAAKEIHGVAAPAPLAKFTVPFDSPLRYHRVNPMFTFSTSVPLADISTQLLGEAIEHKAINFYSMDSTDKNKEGVPVPVPYPSSLLLQQLLQDRFEIIDVMYSINASASTAPATTTKKSEEAAKSSVLPILQIFSSKGGLTHLVELLFKLTNEKYKQLKSSQFKQWKQWLRELKSHLHISGYSQLFIKSTDCISLLQKVMTFVKESADFSTKLEYSEDSADDEEESTELNNPSEPLYDILFQLFSSQSAAEESTIRSEALESGVMNLILNRLSKLCAIQHRNPQRFFKRTKQEGDAQTSDADKKKEQEKRQEYWAKGTGFGTTADDKLPSTWSHSEYTKLQEFKAKQIDILLQGVHAFLSLKGDTPDGLYSLFDDSCLLPCLESYLRNDSLLDMIRFKSLHMSVLKLLKALAVHDKLLPLLMTASPVFTLVSKLHNIADVILKAVNQNKDKFDKKSDSLEELKPLKRSDDKDKKSSDTLEEQELAQAIVDTSTYVLNRVKESDTLSKKEEEKDAAASTNDPFHQQYVATLADLQFAEFSMKKKEQYVHHYKSRLKDETIGSNEKVKRLIQEVGSMSTSLPIHPHSSIFVRVDSERIDLMQALITGPTGTPYANGAFQFDIYCPPDYPKVPPLVNLQTTGGGSVRFNPNLYNCGKVCLSLLGTWKGAENEKWNAKTSTLLQVFISIQSLILVEEPYFNEPGYETEIGKPSGIQHSREYNEVIRVATMKWAMLEQLKKPSPGFEEVITTHFKLKRNEILKQCSEWVKEAATSKTSGHYEKIKKVYEELQKELQKLDPSPLQIPDLQNK